MENVQIINPCAETFNGTLGISDTRADFLADNVVVMIEEAMNPDTPVISEAQLLARVSTLCETTTELAYVCWKTGQVIQEKFY